MSPQHIGRSSLALRSRWRRRLVVEPLESRELLSTGAVFPIPTAASAPVGITTGSDGSLWFVEAAANQIGSINPTTHAITEIQIPTPASSPEGIAAGPDGNLWFTEKAVNQIGMISPTTQSITEFPVRTRRSDPEGIPVGLGGIAAGPDGNLWFTESDAGEIGMISPATHAITEVSIPLDASAPTGIASGPDGNLWFTDPGTNQIGTINPTTHDIMEFPIPTAGSGPRGITTGPDGNLWFTETAADQIGMINPTTHELSEYPVPIASSQPYSITTGPDGNLWFTEPEVNMVGILDPATQSITEASVLPTNSEPIGITAGPDGNLWMTEGSNSIAVFTPTDLVVTTEPPSPVDTVISFGLTVSVSTAEGRLDTGFNGPVTLALVSDPDLGSNPGGATLGGTLTVNARNGVATFSGLNIDRAGTYKIEASTGPLVAVVTASVTVGTPPPPIVAQPTLFDPPPTIVAEKVLFYRRLRGRPQHLRGFELDFSQAMDASDAGETANYGMTQTLEHRRSLLTLPVNFRATYDATAHSVTLTLVGAPTFARGGRLVVIARQPPGVINVFPDGIADANGVSLDGDNQGVSGDDGTFIIAPKGSAISR